MLSHRAQQPSALYGALLKAVTGSAGLRFAGLALTFLVGIQLARGLGVEGYGTYGMAMAIITLLMVPAEFGFPQLLTREVAAASAAGDKAAIVSILRWASRASFCIAAIIAIGLLSWLVMSASTHSVELQMSVVWGAAFIPIVAQISLHAAVLRGMQEIVKGEAPDVLLRPLYYSMLLFASSWWFGSITPSVAMLLAVVAAAVALLVVRTSLMKSLGEVESNESKIDFRAMWMTAGPMAATNGLGVLRGQAIILILSVLMSPAAVGEFRIASSVLGLVAFPVGVLNIVCAPYIASLHCEGRKVELRRVLLLLSAGSSLGVLFLSLPFIFAGDLFFGRIFGAEFISANKALVVLAVGTFLSNIFGGNVVLLNMTSHHRAVVMCSLISILVLLISGYYLVARFGVMGGAVAYVMSNFLSDFSMWLYAQQRLGAGAAFFWQSTAGEK